MRWSWAQTAAGALIGAVVGGLLLLPGHLLGPDRQSAPLRMPAAHVPVAVQAAPGSVVVRHPVKPARVARHQAVARTSPAAPPAQLASVVVHRSTPATPVVAVHHATNPKPVRTPRPTRHLPLPAEPTTPVPPAPAPTQAPTPTPVPAPTPTPTPTAAPTAPAPAGSPAAVPTVTATPATPTPTTPTVPTHVYTDRSGSSTKNGHDDQHDQGDHSDHGDHGNHCDGHGSGHGR